MAKPRVFVSSTYYDLKHIRASLENFIDSLGYEAVLSEKGDIAYSPDIPLDESCYREVATADIFVLIVGGRYGSYRSSEKKTASPKFFERYESITKGEYKAALGQDIPVYVFVESAVHAEYQTFLRNKGKKEIDYAHVDSVNIFLLLEEILSQPRNNPVQQFDRYSDIETWLRDQWAGLFKEFLNKASSQKQIESLRAQITQLAEINETMRRYLEEVVSKVSPSEAGELIAHESQRLIDARLEANDFFQYVQSNRVSLVQFRQALENAHDLESFLAELDPLVGDSAAIMRSTVKMVKVARDDINEARAILSLPPFSEDAWAQKIMKEGASPTQEKAEDVDGSTKLEGGDSSKE